MDRCLPLYLLSFQISMASLEKVVLLLIVGWKVPVLGILASEGIVLIGRFLDGSY